MKPFQGIWRNPESNSEVEFIHQDGDVYLISYTNNGYDQEESIQISIESEAAAIVSYCKRFSNGIEGSEARMYIINEGSLIIGGEPFLRKLA